VAGGSGTQLWPLSRAAYPNQFLALHGGDTMLQSMVRRLEGLNIDSPWDLLMFTKKTIKASHLPSSLNLEVIRDFDFSYCGKLGLNLSKMLVQIESEKYLNVLESHSCVTGVVCRPEMVDLINQNLGLIVSANPRESLNNIQDYISLLSGFQWKDFDSKIDPLASIHPRAWVAEKNVIIGKNVNIGPNAVVYPRTIIEDDVRIGACSVIGCDAFENNLTDDGLKSFAQSGGVILRKSSRIFSNACLTRATYGGFTEIGEQSQIDNLVHIAHDCIVGRNVKVVACAEVSGRVSIGDNSTIGMNATILNGLTIGSNCDVSLGAVVTRDLDNGKKVTGNFAIPHKEFLSNLRRSKEVKKIF
jgi:UDP-3-O-[3-hydroxymyristoyl] glucosamine N-acyltransferase